jgi:hypothetical protein
VAVGRSIAGRTPGGHPTDLYATPPEATRALLAVETFAGGVLEPCSGRGDMARVLEDALGPGRVTASDLLDDGYGTGGVDAYTYGHGSHDNVVTNPPYRHATDLAGHLVGVARAKTALLLKLTFLESERRQPLFASTPLSRVWVFTRRVTMWPHGQDRPTNSGTITFAWFVWDHAHQGPPTLGWVDPR